MNFGVRVVLTLISFSFIYLCLYYSFFELCLFWSLYFLWFGGGILKSLTLKNVAEFLEIYSFYTFVVNIQLILEYSKYLPTTLDLT